MVLINLIFLYNIDGIEDKLKNTEKIKDLQANYCSLLHKYLKSKHSPEVANIMFGKGLMLIHETKKAYDLSQQRLKLMDFHT